MRESSQRLHDAIREAIGTFAEPTPEQLALLDRVQRDCYNDYFGEYDMPAHTLMAHLRLAGLPQLLPRVIDGEFDGTKEEADEWTHSEEGRKAFGELLGE